MSDGFILKPFRVSVSGFDSYVYPARSRQKALADAWRSYCGYRDDVDFRAFLKMAKVAAEPIPERWGEPLTISGELAFYVSHNRQYIQFARAGSDVVLSSHPLDVEPPEARRGTPYYQPAALHGDQEG